MAVPGAFVALGDLTNPQTVDIGNPEDERWILVNRIVSSPPFSRAPQLRGFLLFVASRALSGRAGEITEQEIGRAVLGRRANFNPHEDNIVRVQARHLRAKLEQYFETEGKQEPITVTIPRGAYVPVFEPRLPAVAAVSAPASAPPVTAGQIGGKTRLSLSILAACLLVVILFGLGKGFRRAEAAKNAPAREPGNPLLARVFRSGDSSKIIISDTGLVMLQEFLHHKLSLDDYLKGDYPRSSLPPSIGAETAKVLARDCLRPYTNYGDTEAANRLLQLSQSYQAKAVIRHPRQLNVRDFETSSFILVGGPLANPWYGLFENRLNFAFEPNLDTGRVAIRNKAPQPGEQAIYTPKTGPEAVDYAIIGLFPNLRASGSVLLLAGSAMEGTEAASDMVIRENLPAFLQRILEPLQNPTDSAEVLIETHVVAGVPRDSQVIAYRVNRAGH